MILLIFAVLKSFMLLLMENGSKTIEPLTEIFVLSLAVQLRASKKLELLIIAVRKTF